MKIISILIISLFCIFSNSTGAQQENIREPAVSGMFYPESSLKLEKMIDKFISSCDMRKKDYKGKVMGIIVPHAGYIYSGNTAAYGFKAVDEDSIKNVILLGSSHRYHLENLTMCDYTIWKTPLGKVGVNKELMKKIKNRTNAQTKNHAFKSEHCLEVEIPFLQRTIKKDFKIVPLLINNYKVKHLIPIAKKMSDILKKEQGLLFVMSTDMSHYYTSEKAVEMDKKVINALENNDLNNLQDLIDSKQGQLCGAGGVMLGLLTLREMGAEEIKCLHYSHSGEISGDNSKVVGYGAFSIVKGKKEKNMGLNTEQKKKLLKIARNTIEEYVKNGEMPQIEVQDEQLKEKRGVFVTLHKNGELRGCIGHIMPEKQLYLAVREMAVQSSTKDPRFPPVTEDEIDELEIEISVLTVPKQVKSADEIELKRDGVIVKKGFKQGVYLPQVAEETGWSKEKFLSSLCYSKAGLQPDAWKNGSTQLLTFQADVFSESDLELK
ncbi:MAG: AmmeMemoRadiSam system protein B [Elusimicrobiota bacterium]